jgi:hypothetical protein
MPAAAKYQRSLLRNRGIGPKEDAVISAQQHGFMGARCLIHDRRMMVPATISVDRRLRLHPLYAAKPLRGRIRNQIQQRKQVSIHEDGNFTHPLGITSQCRERNI